MKKPPAPRKRKEEDYEEYMTGIPSAAPAITGALREHGERKAHESENREGKSEPNARETESAKSVSEAPKSERRATEAAKSEPAAKVVEVVATPAREAMAEEVVVAVREVAAVQEAAAEGEAVVAREVAAPRVGRRARLVREIELPRYAAGGRRAAEDLAGQRPVRQSVTLAPAQVARLQREVQRRKRSGKRADLSSLCRELIERLRNGEGERPAAASHGDARFVAQTLYLTEAQVQWLVAEVLRRRESGDGADKSALIREAIELWFASDSTAKKS